MGLKLYHSFQYKNAALVSKEACLGYISISVVMSDLPSSIIFRSPHVFAWVKL